MSINLRSDKIEKFREIQDGLSYSVGEPNVSIRQLMNDEFIRQKTAFENWENLLRASQITDEKDLETPALHKNSVKRQETLDVPANIR